MLCCQNPKFEDDLESLNKFIKTMQESVQGMRASVSAFQASAAEFQKAMINQQTQKNKEPFNTQPFQNPASNFEQNEETMEETQKQFDISSDTKTEEN
ncbi:hypothetical protein [Desulfolucanica intricata]|uniref:hypothetical protein n=1 Tax=Desulfolucanica intricata TaxID=1285191 RepID=UPI0008301200|nr:hypothetical protein [Desulfolucanica intricata]